ncbi:MAG TPA: ATP-binding protein [Gemmatimonadales bacterium]|nr:ATP-binding protein [Gemmatimonadales bacterium]
MRDITVQLLRDAREAATVEAFWERAAESLRTWSGAARVALQYEAERERGTVTTDGAAVTDPHTIVRGADGRRVEVTFHGARPDLPAADLDVAVDLVGELTLMVGRRATLERDQRLGSFVIELSRWLLAAPERDLMLRYTLQSVMKLFDAEGAYAALREPSGDGVRVVTALGRTVEFDGMLLPLDHSTTGRVVRSGEAMITDNIREEPDIYMPAGITAVALARAAMIVPLQSSGGVLGAIGLVRFRRGGGDAPPPPTFTIADLHFFTGVAAHVAAGLELSHSVATTRAAADRTSAMVHASPLPLLLVDPDGCVHLLNEAGHRVFGLDQSTEVTGAPLARLGISTPDGDLLTLMNSARRGGPWHGRVVVRQPSGDQRICDCTVTDLKGLGSADLLIALYDRTEELRAQRELIAREKLATVGEIASGVAHEVNNPLAAIRMEAELLASTEDPETGAAARTIVREVDRAASIIRSLLQLARRADSAPTPVNVNDLVRDVAVIRRRVLRSENVQVETEIDARAPTVLGLSQELMQVVINLVTNAEHALRHWTPAVIRISTHGMERWVRLVVEDSGPGVPDDLRQRIFDPFFTTKSPDEGSGLGLSICQRVVSELGGRIRLEDSELGGARFVVELPAAPIPALDELDIR